MRNAARKLFDEGGGDGAGGGEGDSGISGALNQGDGDGGGDSGSSSSSGDQAFSLYTGDVEGRTINPQLAAMLEGDENTAIRQILEKYKGGENPDGDFWQGIKNLKYLTLRKGDPDMLAELPDDAPESLKQERNSLIRKINGAPEDAAGYELKKPEQLPEGVEWPEGAEMKYAEIAAKHGASKALMQDLMTAHLEILATGPAMAEANYTQMLNDANDSLKQEFGHDIQKVVDMADRGGLSSGQFTGDQMELLMRAATSVGLGPNLVKHMKWTADSISEDKRVNVNNQGEGHGGKSNAEKARSIAQDKNNPLHEAFYNVNDPKHEEAVNAASNFNKQAHDMGEL